LGDSVPSFFARNLCNRSLYYTGTSNTRSSPTIFSVLRVLSSITEQRRQPRRWFSISARSFGSPLQFRMLTNRLGLENEAAIRNNFVVKLQPVEHGEEPV
jgi:hypothetical protein